MVVVVIVTELVMISRDQHYETGKSSSPGSWAI